MQTRPHNFDIGTRRPVLICIREAQWRGVKMFDSQLI